MKNKKFLTVLSTAIFFTIALVVVVSCQKTADVKDPVVSGLDDESNIVTQHILDFKANMEYYKNNHGLRSSEKEYVLDAILDWESTLNFDYCYSYVDVSEIKIYDTIIAIPIDANDSLAMTDVSGKYYNDILVAVQTHYYVYAPFTNQKLLVVDLEPTTNYDSVVVSTWIGNDTPGMLHPEYDWKYGDYGGTCDGQHYVGISDAAKQAAIYVRFHFEETPPEGLRWYFPNPVNIYAKPLDKNIDGTFKFINLA
ncbi:MAG: hypothetical protein L3J66_04825 [Bacteroidales bacterium]|nr:hypothetical protein [Bacteroidales bacterium]